MRGGLITLLSYACVVYLSVELFARYIGKEDPVVVQYEDIKIPDGYYNLLDNRQIFTVMVTELIEDEEGQDLDPRIGKIAVNSVDYKVDTKTSIVSELELHECDLTHF